MGDEEALDFDEFRRVIDDISTKKRHESAAVARATKEGFLFGTYERLCRKDGTFTLGSFRKSLASIGISLNKRERLELFERVVPPSKEDKMKPIKKRRSTRPVSYTHLTLPTISWV